MKLVSIKCPSCGADLEINAEAKQAFCTYCGTKVFVDDEVQHVQYDNAEVSIRGRFSDRFPNRPEINVNQGTVP